MMLIYLFSYLALLLACKISAAEQLSHEVDNQIEPTSGQGTPMVTIDENVIFRDTEIESENIENIEVIEYSVDAGEEFGAQQRTILPNWCKDYEPKFSVENVEGFVRDTIKCEWVARKDTEIRCKNKKVKGMCPATCGSADSENTFEFGDDNQMTCTLVAKKNTEIRCANEKVRRICPATCQSCEEEFYNDNQESPSTNKPDSKKGSHSKYPKSLQPSNVPVAKKSKSPSHAPSATPSLSSIPSVNPTTQPSSSPSVNPTTQPSSSPSDNPTTQPSSSPSYNPSAKPSVSPSTEPSLSSRPSEEPTMKPSSSPSDSPSAKPSVSPSTEPSLSSFPSVNPTMNPSASPSIQPSLSSSPSVTPTMIPSVGPTMEPSLSASPSDSPSIFCYDEPSWNVSGYEENSALALFANKTCPELAEMVDVDGHESWCDFHRANTKEGKSAAEACCFCAGGGYYVPTPCEDHKGWSLSASNSDDIINCDFISNSSKDPSQFCELVEDHMGTGEVKAKEACCVCGGGFRPLYSESVPSLKDNDNAESTRRRQQEVKSSSDNEYVDWKSSRSDLDEFSYGIPNLEFLGLGYDGLRGNPRGSLSSKIDPGFRSRVFALLQTPDVLSIDQAFTIPLGTEFKYTSSCNHDSVSNEVSSEDDYVSSLSKEANMISTTSSTSSSISLSNRKRQYGFSNIFPARESFHPFDPKEGKGLQDGVRPQFHSHAFKKSEYFNSFRSIMSHPESPVLFEVEAICSEFEVMFRPYAEKTLDPLFEIAVTNLPTPYQPKSPEHRYLYSKFISSYGSHYSSKVVLGAKRILSTAISSQAITELTRESVDISSTLSLSMQEAMAMTSSQRMGLSAAASLTTDPAVLKGPKFRQACYSRDGSSAMNKEHDGGNDCDVDGSSDHLYDNFARTQEQSKAASKIASKQVRTTEVNIGGLQGIDRKETATRTKEKPMPISYELVGLWNLMDGAHADAFYKAYIDIENIKIASTVKKSNRILNTMHFGVTSGSGEPLSSYSLDPKIDYRALLQVDNIPAPVSSEPNETVVLGSNAFPGNYAKIDNKHSFACGIKVHVDTDTNVDENDIHGVSELYLKFCNINDWNDQSDHISMGGTSDKPKSGRVVINHVCPKNHFIDGMRVRYCMSDTRGKKTFQCNSENQKGGVDFWGIHGLDISCLPLGGQGPNRVTHRVFCRGRKLGGKLTTDCTDDAEWDEWKYIVEQSPSQALATNSIATGIIGASVENGPCCEGTSEPDDVGIVGINLVHRNVPLPGSGLNTAVITYSTKWKGMTKTPVAVFASAIRGNVGKDRVEEVYTPSLGDTQKFDRSIDLVNNVPFIISDDHTSPGAIALSQFGQKLSKADLTSFSFLTAEDVIGNHKDLVVGVVSESATILNDFGKGGPGFEVERSGGVSFHVDLVGSENSVDTNKETNKEMPSNPVVIASPNWYSKGGSQYPLDLAHIAIAVKRASSDKNAGQGHSSFDVEAGTWARRGGTHSLSGRNLGFNFMAIDPNLDDEHIRFGFVDVDDDKFADGNVITNTTRWAATMEGSKNPPYEGAFQNELCNQFRDDNKCPQVSIHGWKGGVRIDFDTPFDALPAVIVTPVVDEVNYSNDSEGRRSCSRVFSGFTWDQSPNGSGISIPHCVVETIQKGSIFVKCGCVQMSDFTSTEDDAPIITYTMLPFNFIAVGPSSLS